LRTDLFWSVRSENCEFSFHYVNKKTKHATINHQRKTEMNRRREDDKITQEERTIHISRGKKACKGKVIACLKFFSFSFINRARLILM